MQGKVEICGINTAKLKVLSSAETQQLLLKCQQGDKKAREELIQGLVSALPWLFYPPAGT